MAETKDLNKMDKFRLVLNKLQGLIDEGDGAYEGDLKALWNNLSDAITDKEKDKTLKSEGKTNANTDSNCNLQNVSGSFSADTFVEILKRTLEGNNEVRVEFDNEEDNINYVLDVCNNFRKELEKNYR